MDKCLEIIPALDSNQDMSNFTHSLTALPFEMGILVKSSLLFTTYSNMRWTKEEGELKRHERETDGQETWRCVKLVGCFRVANVFFRASVLSDASVVHTGADMKREERKWLLIVATSRAHMVNAVKQHLIIALMHTAVAPSEDGRSNGVRC